MTSHLSDRNVIKSNTFLLIFVVGTSFFENRIVEEKHINALKRSIVENDDELVELAMAFGWRHSEGRQFCMDCKEMRLHMKFFLLVKKWTYKLGDTATIGKLISALDDIEKGGEAKRILLSIVH